MIKKKQLLIEKAKEETIEKKMKKIEVKILKNNEQQIQYELVLKKKIYMFQKVRV